MAHCTSIVFFLLSSFQVIIITTILISNMFKGKLQFLRYESGGDASSAPNRTSFVSYGDFKGGRKMFVSGSHFFCHPRSFTLSEKRVDAVGENSLLRVLYLPDGTLITEELRAFARCLASAKYLSVTNKLDYCWCFGGMTYGSLFLWSIFNCFIGGCCFFHTLVTLVHMDGDCSKINLQIGLTNVCQLPWTLLKFLFWLFLSSYASYYNFTWMDDVILPSPNVENRTNRPVPYFRRPWMWHAVIFLAWIYCFSCLAEILLILIVGSDETDQKHECDKLSPSWRRQRSSSSDSPTPSPSSFVESSYLSNNIDNDWEDDDSWNVVSYPSSIKEREKCTLAVDRPPSISSFP